MCRIHFPFYLNVVGYKLKNLDIALFIAYNKFYLNVVGYKLSYLFGSYRKISVLSERSGI